MFTTKEGEKRGKPRESYDYTIVREGEEGHAQGEKTKSK